MPQTDRYRFDGTKLPDDHYMDPIWAELHKRPRDRRYVVGVLVNRDAGTGYPEDEEDFEHVLLGWVELTAITDPAAIDQLQAMIRQARADRPGPVPMAFGQGTADAPDE